MAARARVVLRFCRCLHFPPRGYVNPQAEPGTFPFPKRQVPINGNKTFKDRLDYIKSSKNVPFSDIAPINIGYDIEKSEMLMQWKKIDKLEHLARKRQLIVELDDIRDNWLSSSIGRTAVVNFAHYYGVYKDLFNPVLDVEYPSAFHFFYPLIPLQLVFQLDQTTELPVWYGNIITPKQAKSEPIFLRENLNPELFYTLILTSPDENIFSPNSEIIHWATGNVAINSNGDNIIPYLHPLPYNGCGYHRYVFVLYEHKEPIDFNELRPNSINQLEDRQFNTYAFYRKFQNRITPVGISFFQSSWDETVREKYRNDLVNPEPYFQIRWPMEHRPKQQHHPAGKSFNKYLDDYRDIHDLREEVLKERLKRTHPLKEETGIPFENAVPLPHDMPSWLKDKTSDQRLRKGIWSELDPEK